MFSYDLLAIVGPTASGKTWRAVSLARHLKGEIISGDSRQVYRKMDLGTGKDLSEYGEIKYHLIDICDPGEKYNLYRYLHDFYSVLSDIRQRNVFPILCGGSGMYVESAISGIRLPEVPENVDLRKSLEGKNLDELAEILREYKTLHNTTDVDTEKRAVRAIEIEEFYKRNPDMARNVSKADAEPLNALIIGIDVPRDVRRDFISKRLASRLDDGMVDEVKNILASGVAADDLIYYGLEYKFLTLYLIGRISFEEMKDSLEIAIHQFAKRQMTWLRGMERRGFHINWLPYDMPDDEFNSKVLGLLSSPA